MKTMVFHPLVFLALACMSQPCMAARLAQELAEHSDSYDGIVNVEDHGADDALAEFTNTNLDADDALAEFTTSAEFTHQTPSFPRGFRRKEHGDCEGFDLFANNLGALDRRTCGWRCQRAPGCLGFTWDPYHCYPKKRQCPDTYPEKIIPAGAWEFHYRIPEGFETLIEDCPYEQMIDDIDSAKMHECAELCEGSEHCQGFSYGPHGECYTRSRVCESTTHNGFSFFRRLGIQSKGQWVGVGFIPSSGENMTMAVGMTQTNTHGSSSSIVSEITTSLETGFEIPGAEMSASVSQTLGRSITHGVEFSQSTSGTHSVTRSFIPHPGGNYLWQWVFKFYRQGTLQAEARMPRFAYTAGRWQPPACLPGFAHDPTTGYQNCVEDRYRIHYSQ